MDLTPSTRRRGLIVLLAITFLMYAGFFMVIPLLAVVYVEQLGFAAATVGLALGMRQLLQQGITLVGGMLADRFGVRPLIGAGVLVRVVGFVSLAYADTPPLLFLAMLFSALGGALFEAPSRAAMAALARPEEQARYYSLVGVVSGLGMTVGPLVGALLLRFNFQTVALAASGCFLLIFGTVLLLPPIKVAQGRQGIGYGLGLAMRDRTFLIFTALLMGYWFMWVQLLLSLPLVAERLAGSSDAVGLIYALNAGLTVLFQYPIFRLVERWLRPMPMLIIGTAIMALGLGAVAIADSLALLVVCVVVFTLGTLLATPTQQSVTASLADQRAMGSYFGVSALALALGGGLGNLAGGVLTDAARRVGQPALPWLTYALVGMASAIGLAMLADSLRYRRATAHLVRLDQAASPTASD
jgi:MFS transporter, DHA1 family, multidrug resistance protein